MGAAIIVDRSDRYLVGRRADGWLTGWLAVALWIASWIANHAGHSIGSLGIPLYWPAAILSAMHFGITYHLAYAGGASAVRRRPFALAIGPAILCVVLAGVVAISVLGGPRQTARTAELAILSVFLLTAWHYIKQVYGVARIGARYRGISFTVQESRVLRYGLYPLWLIGACQVLTHGRGTRFAGFNIGLDLLPPATSVGLRILALCSATAIAYVVVSSSRRAGVWPPALIVAPYVAAFLWLAAPTDFYGAFLALGALHGLQYLACCRRAEGGFGLPRLSRRSALRWAEIFGGASCGGLLIAMWMPEYLNRVLAVDSAPLLFTAVFFVFLNLHHYLIDAVIWRSSGDLVRSMTATPSPPTKVPTFEVMHA